MENIDSQLTKYRPPKGKIEIDVRFQEDTVWLTQSQMADLFAKNKRTISEHVNNIFKEGELKEKSAIRNIRTSAADGKVYKTNHYNFDVIISVGYRVKSPGITPFRYWVDEQFSGKKESSWDNKIDKQLQEIETDIEELLNKINKATL
jgi:hypothetical protein